MSLEKAGSIKLFAACITGEHVLCPPRRRQLDALVDVVVEQGEGVVVVGVDGVGVVVVGRQGVPGQVALRLCHLRLRGQRECVALLGGRLRKKGCLSWTC